MKDKFNYSVVISILYAASIGCKNTNKATSRNENYTTQEVTSTSTLPEMPRTYNQLTETMLEEIVNYYRKEYLKDSISMWLSPSDTMLEVSFDDASHDSFGTQLVAYVSLAKHISPAILGDMNSDELPDILFSVHTEGGGTGGLGTYWSDHFLFIASTGGQYKLADIKSDIDIMDGSGYFYPKEIQNQTLIGIGNDYDYYDARCCPSIFYRTRVRLMNNQLKTIDETPIPRPAGYED